MSADTMLKTISDENIEYVDIRFTDPRGKLQHVTVMADQVDTDFIEEGFMFDGSSIAGWKSIEASDMKLMIDTDSTYIDPFYAEKTLCVHCSVVEPIPERLTREILAGPQRKLKPLLNHLVSVMLLIWVQKRNFFFLITSDILTK